MKSRIALCIAVAALLGAASTAIGHDLAQTTRNCGQIGFTPNSDDVASRIRATGLTCGLARDFVRDSRGRPGARFRGLECARTFVPSEGLAYTRFRCTGAGDVIRWQRF